MICDSFPRFSEVSILRKVMNFITVKLKFEEDRSLNVQKNVLANSESHCLEKFTIKYPYVSLNMCIN